MIHLLGDFNDWKPDNNYQLKRNALNNIWWIELTGLTPGQPYRFQYLVDGVLKIADPLSTLVLDPGTTDLFRRSRTPTCCRTPPEKHSAWCRFCKQPNRCLTGRPQTIPGPKRRISSCTNSCCAISSTGTITPPCSIRWIIWKNSA
ncbi:MAG: hypothetical protein H6574_17540 [Lewinellaceae bacterium]|nr:hypothetical protein [Lewinellaceae bacterium]